MKPIDWHRMFGLLLIDLFSKSPFEVELEKDLSIKKQRLDVVILRRKPGPFVGQLPDGFENLTKHNLITFKSHQEVLDDWALKELTGHYVNYRKQVSPSFENLLPESDFGLYAVCSRHPRELAGSPEWKAIQDGVFEHRRGTDAIRVLVLGQLPDAPNNAILHLLSASPEKFGYGVAHFQRQSSDTSSLLEQFLKGYQQEGLIMPYTMEDFRKDYVREHLDKLTPQERLQGLSPEQLLKQLSPEQIEAYLRQLKSKPTPPKRKKKK